MKFLNKKEQVIDLQITPYGKNLFSMGRFKPEYYAFYDDEVLYNSKYAGVSEHQNSASIRIREVPQLQTQTYFYSAERQVKEAVAFHRLSQENDIRNPAIAPRDINGIPYVQNDNVSIAVVPDREFNKAPIGNSDLNSSYAPSWSVNVIEGEIASSSPTQPGLDLEIPQINMTASTILTVLTEDQPVSDNFYEFNQKGNLPEDNPFQGLFLSVIDEGIILEIDEENTTFQWENFDIEIFEVEEVDTPSATNIGGLNTKQFLKPLFFKKAVNAIQNNILLDFDEIQPDSTPITSEFAEYFFDINVDREIDPVLLCERARNKPNGFLSQRELVCREESVEEEVDIENLYIPGIPVDCEEDE